MRPNFIGLGAARAGSTWIARNLMQHPDIFLPGKKELHYFDRHFARGLSFYEQEFADWSGETAIGEITPQYFHNRQVAPLIREQFPGIKLFVCLRNPIQRAYSHYWRLVAVSSTGESENFEEVLKKNREVLEVGCYYDHLCRYFQNFDQKQILVLIFDDLETDPESFLSTIYRFLNVEDRSASQLAQQRINAAASLQGLGRSKTLWQLYRILRKLGLYSIASKIERANRSELPQMKPATKDYLITCYQQQIENLESLIDRDLGSWLE